MIGLSGNEQADLFVLAVSAVVAFGAILVLSGVADVVEQVIRRFGQRK